jgi:hypothetical protein
MGIEKEDACCRLTNVSTEVKNELVERKYNERRIKEGNENNDMRCITCNCDRNKRIG